MEAFVNLIAEYRYLILFPAAVIEGPVITMIAGFLARLGTLNIVFAGVILMVADLVGDMLWYAIGYHWGNGFLNKFGKYFGVTPETIEVVNKFYHKYHNSVLFVSKVTMGLGIPFVTLISAGIAKIPFKKFLMLNFLGQVIWTSGLLAIGYFLGNFYLAVYEKFEAVSFIGLTVFLLVVVFGIGKYVRYQVLRKYS